MNSSRQNIISLLEQSTGMNIGTVSDSTFTQAIQRRLNALHINDIDSYAREVTASEDELLRLTEEIVVPETWFFRHRESFNVLTNRLLEEINNRRHFLARILSMPCSTGEEPYSIIMALLQAEIDPDRFYIKAVDISDRALAIARRGVYGKNSFRSKELSFRDRFFNRVENEYVIRESIRSKVHFARGNITDSSSMAALGRFDIIFCRNILIYFSEETQKKVIDTIYELLVPGGTLFTGHAEANLFLNSRFLRSPHAESFAFHKRNQSMIFKAPPAAIPAKETGGPETVRPKVHKAQKPQPDPPCPATPSIPSPPRDPFKTVLLLADAGELEAAAEACEKHLEDFGPSSRWYYLLGVICDSLGQPEEAVGHLRKALYLDPEHEESLFLLSLLADQTGEHTQAVNYRRRARKVRQKGE